MSIIWIIEPPGLERSVARCLQGDFAVRVFASRASFQLLHRVGRGPAPDLVVWHEDDAQHGVSLGCECPVLALHPDDRRLEDAFGLSGLCRDLMMRGRRQGASLLRYKDLVLDYTRLTLSFTNGQDSATLPLKEGQLLKMLLERAGATLTRSEISAQIWNGVKVTPRTIDSHICRLRKRLRDAGITIHGIYGDGYVLK